MNLIQPHVEKLKLTQAEKKLIQETSAKVDEINTLFRNYQNRGRASIKDARHAASENPTVEALDKLALQVLLEAHADTVARECKTALAPALNIASDKAAPVALRVLDELEAALKADLVEHSKTVATSPLADAVDNGAAKRAVDGALQWLAEQRRRVNEDHAGLALLVELGLVD